MGSWDPTCLVAKKIKKYNKNTLQITGNGWYFMSYVYRRQLMVPWKARKGDPREAQWRKRSVGLESKDPDSRPDCALHLPQDFRALTLHLWARDFPA